MRRVVVTGMGAITPIGNTVKEFWKGIEEKKCGIAPITYFDTENFKVKLAAEIKGYEEEKYFDRKTAKRLDRYSKLAIIAAREALQDSKLEMQKEDATRIGVVISSGIGGLRNNRRTK